MNTLSTIKSVIRANPKFALMAASLDLGLGTIAGVVAFVIASSTVDTPVAMSVTLVLNFLLFAGAIVVAYVNIVGKVFVPIEED